MVIKSAASSWLQIYVPWGDTGTRARSGVTSAYPITILLTVAHGERHQLHRRAGRPGRGGHRNRRDSPSSPTATTLPQVGQVDRHRPLRRPCSDGVARRCLSSVSCRTTSRPARIFMGDSGSMLVGLMLAAATPSTATTSELGSRQASGSGFKGSLPLATCRS